MKNTNRKIVLASRPSGQPTTDNFRLEDSDIPSPQRGEILLRTIYLSLDPYMRGRMNDAESYAEPVKLDDVMVGGTVAQVEQSQHDDFAVGDWVLSYSGWQDYAISNGEGLINLGKNPTQPSYALGVMGMPGFTAYMGLMDIGQPKKGDTLVVAATTGAVGSIVGQIGKLMGCKVIGIAGGSEKCQYAIDNLGFDHCIDHKAPDFAEQLAATAENGIDIYFENVGGKVFDAVLPLLNTGARIPVCGLISQYNATSLPDGPDRMSSLVATLLIKRIKMQGFIIFDDYGHRYNEFSQAMQEWLSQGKIQYKEHVIEGLDKAPEAFIGLLNGENFGKLIIHTNQAN
ncbi:NADP-dependent oxidoreductase [Vibrio sp. S4M6]|uniref:NADP-dependent oxidoreductase n=1 Tax=Vibrio sinus TaxID=2946865 RepID=UPI00202AB506|nr:NADP-dependent oxidoreductase [Vibrio sinus]MCL9779993.1 NADP-dependent oxidoreductase [Vibrio sinus]